jgi:hypothetical protein
LKCLFLHSHFLSPKAIFFNQDVLLYKIANLGFKV